MKMKWIALMIGLLLAAGGCRISDPEDNSVTLTLTRLVPAARAQHLPGFTLSVNGGYYLVKVVSETGVTTQKVYIN